MQDLRLDWEFQNQDPEFKAENLIDHEHLCFLPDFHTPKFQDQYPPIHLHLQYFLKLVDLLDFSKSINLILQSERAAWIHFNLVFQIFHLQFLDL